MPVPETLVNDINEARMQFLEATNAIAQSVSFQALLHNSDELRSEWTRQVRDIAKSPRVTRKCTGTFTCAFVGTSNAGKTTILREMFPYLAAEGKNWLVTRTTDTTSQALRIHACNDPEELDVAHIRSWGMEEIERLIYAAREEHEKHGIVVTPGPDSFDINAEDANLEDRNKYKFGLRYEIRPLSGTSFRLRKNLSQEEINRLTVKLPWKEVNTKPIPFGGHSFHALQLRAVVKEVELRDPFDGLCALSGRPLEQLRDLVFLDTPGLNTKEIQFDEILQFALFHKNRHIITELLRNDELDLIIHLVLAGQQSVFKDDLWKKIEKECPEDLADLAERVVVAINGMNKFLTDPNISRHWREPRIPGQKGDQFQDVVETNILATMNPVKPARICFLDSKNFVEESNKRSYQEVFAEHRREMERWTRPGGPGYDTLKGIGLLDSFQENIKALCDPKDCGQGFLVRQILDLLERHGCRLTVRKFLIRSQLKKGIDKARQILLRYYDATTGGLDKWQIVQQVIRRFFPSITPDDLSSINTFFERHLKSHIDEELDRFLPKPDGSLDSEIKWFTFKITDSSLTALEDSGLADDILHGLASLKGRVFETEQQFLTALTSIDGAMESRDLIMNHARDCVWVRAAYKQACKLVYKTSIDMSGRFRITDQILATLRNEGMPSVIARKLMNLKGRTLESLEGFEKELAGVLTVDEETQWHEQLVQNSRIANDADAKRNQAFFTDYINKQMKECQEQWGYRTAVLPVPTGHDATPIDLIRHALHLHVQELIYQMVSGAANDPAKNTLQDAHDRKQVLSVLNMLEKAAKGVERLCQLHGVQP